MFMLLSYSIIAVIKIYGFLYNAIETDGIQYRQNSICNLYCNYMIYNHVKYRYSVIINETVITNNV